LTTNSLAGRESGDTTTAPVVATEFERDVLPLFDLLYRHAFRMTSNHADAEDLLQETAIKAYAGLNSFLPGSNLKAWLFRIMINTYIGDYRKKKRQPVHVSAEVTTGRRLVSAAGRPAALRSAEDLALDLLPDPQIKAAMEDLPEQFREAVYFADIVGYSYKEIAAMLDIRQGTVSSRINRGRRQLRDLLADSPGARRISGARRRGID
jgi:RNA polymerase sigma-70 factor (ECF subfamily)